MSFERMEEARRALKRQLYRDLFAASGDTHWAWIMGFVMGVLAFLVGFFVRDLIQ